MKNFLIFNLIFGFALLAVSLNGTEVALAQCWDDDGNQILCPSNGSTGQGGGGGNGSTDQGGGGGDGSTGLGGGAGNGSTGQGGGGGNGQAGGNQNGPGQSFQPIKIFDPVKKSITEIFRAILDIIMVFAIPIIVFFIVWAGFLYVKAAGNASEIEKAHKALLYALVGGLIILGANIILAVITNTINLFVN